MGGRAGGEGPSRRVHISKAMSWLLRHGAHKEGVPMNPQGYVNVADMLKWQKMRNELNVTFQEVLDEVQNNEKQRFALLHLPPEAVPSIPETAVMKENATTAVTGSLGAVDEVTEQINSYQIQSEDAATVAPTRPASSSGTAQALESALSSPDPDPSQYLIRATQGHSITTVSASTYLSPLTLDNASSIPETVVHGTFYAAWDAILRTGGLKPMSRVHVHFATGPSLRSVLDATSTDGEVRDAAGVLGTEKAVISGMRSDAQILMYVNIRKALQMGIPFWMSENGVVLSEGIPGSEGRYKNTKVPMECVDVAVEVKQGLGVLWQAGKVVKELPNHFKKTGWPHRKDRKARGAGAVSGPNNEAKGPAKKAKGKPAGGGVKPKLVVESDALG